MGPGPVEYQDQRGVSLLVQRGWQRDLPRGLPERRDRTSLVVGAPGKRAGRERAGNWDQREPGWQAEVVREQRDR